MPTTMFDLKVKLNIFPSLRIYKGQIILLNSEWNKLIAKFDKHTSRSYSVVNFPGSTAQQNIST
mgnify:CR=1 FL=1